ncbi:MAG: hypothetical protein V1746_02230 [bacterium]
MSYYMTQDAGDTQNFFKNSPLYREFLLEREEILRHKWLESEKVGHDIGFEKALLDWIVRYRAKWRTTRQKMLASAEKKNEGAAKAS